jgi:hypothetical protein
MMIEPGRAKGERLRDDPPIRRRFSDHRAAARRQRSETRLRCPVHTLCPCHLIETTADPVLRTDAPGPAFDAETLRLGAHSRPSPRPAEASKSPSFPGGVIIPSFDFRPCMRDPLLSASKLRGDKCKV